MVERLRDGVTSRMVADVPLGAFLSGGVDSSAVVAFMAEASRGAVETCSIGFDAADHDETRYAAQVAELFATNHRTRIVASEDFGLIDILADAFDEPFADASALGTYRVSELAREKVKVALSGDGADEAMAGYRRYRLFSAEERVRRLLPAPFARAAGMLGDHYPKLDWAPQMFRAKTTLQALGQGSGAAYANAVGVTPPPIRRAGADRAPARPCRRGALHPRLRRRAGERPALARPICRSQDLAAGRHPDQGRPHLDGGEPRGARAFARSPPGRVRRAAAGASCGSGAAAANG